MTTTHVRLLKGITLLVASLTLSFSALAQTEIVYNNSANSLNSFYASPGGLEFGDQINLAGLNRLITQFEFEYFSTVTEAASKVGLLRIYANDGVGGAPSTVLYSSDPFAIKNDFNSVKSDLTSASVLVPDTVTWTVTFSGLSSGEQAGLLLYDPPTFGSSLDDFWQRNAFGNWGTLRLQDGAINANFAAKVTAVPEPSVIQLGALAGFALLGLSVYRRRLV